MIDKEAVRKDRAAGMRYADIAEKHGCSKQYIGLICRGYNPKSFHFVSQDGCIYPNWRRWMNENRVSRAELLVRMGYEPESETYGRLRDYMTGQREPKKRFIDGLIRVTGLRYECLFSGTLWEGEHGE